MAIRGSLREASLPDVLQLLSMGNKMGLLTIDRGDQVGRIYFDGGRIAYAEIDNRHVTAEEAVYLMFTWDDGAFNFEPSKQPPDGVAVSSIDPQSVLLEGARRVDEWAVVEKKIHSFDLVFALERQELLRTKLELTADQQALLPLIDGHRDVAALIEQSGLGEFVVGKELYGLITAGFVIEVGRSGAASAKPADGPDLDEHRNLGMAFFRAAMYDEAMAEFTRVLDAKEDDASAAFYVGLISVARRDWATAASAFQRATCYAPEAITPLHNLSYALAKLGQPEKARRVCDEILERTGRREPVVLTWSGALAIKMRDPKLANADLAAARALWGDARPPAVWYHHSALAAALEGDLQRAEKVLSDAIEAHPHGAALHNNLAVVLGRRGRYDEARLAAERGISANASLPQLHANLGDVLLHTGMHAEAQAAYRRGRQSALR